MIDHLSYSSMSAYMRCPKQFYYSRVEQPPWPIYTSHYLFLGSTVHKILDDYFKARIAGHPMSIAETVAAFEQDFDDRTMLHESSTGVDWKNQDEAYIKDLGSLLLGNYLRSPAAVRLIPVQTEFTFNRVLGGIPITGRVDLIDSLGRIVDFKVTKKAKSQRAADKDLQPTFYAAGFGGPIEFNYHFILKQLNTEVVVVKTQRTQSDIDYLANELMPGVWNGIQQGLFPPCDPGNWLCDPRYCDYWHICKG